MTAEINQALRAAPDKCRNCDFESSPLKNYRTGEVYYPRIPGGLCDECHDYERETETCGKCFHFDRCAWLIQRRPEQVPCDWSPSRFTATPNTQEIDR